MTFLQRCRHLWLTWRGRPDYDHIRRLENELWPSPFVPEIWARALLRAVQSAPAPDWLLRGDYSK